MTGAHGARSAAKQAGGRAERGGKRVENSAGFAVLVTVGLIAYGIVHLLVALIAVQLAWTGTSRQASQKGAFQQMASQPLGRVLVWVTAAGLLALTLWQLFEALWGHRGVEQGRKRIVKQLGSAGKAVVYLALAASAASTAKGSSSNSNTSEKTLTAKLLAVPFGRILVVLVGVVVMVVAARLMVKGITKTFRKDLAGSVGTGVIKVGEVGYTAKGVALGIVGILFVVAAVTANPQKAGGLDTALRTLRSQSFGPILLTVVAIGIACFGLYCFAWSRHVKKT
jgi:Ca2+/Na+ antiporter